MVTAIEKRLAEVEEKKAKRRKTKVSIFYVKIPRGYKQQENEIVCLYRSVLFGVDKLDDGTVIEEIDWDAIHEEYRLKFLEEQRQHQKVDKEENLIPFQNQYTDFRSSESYESEIQQKIEPTLKEKRAATIKSHGLDQGLKPISVEVKAETGWTIKPQQYYRN